MQIPQEISTEEFYLLYLSLENTPEAVFWLDAQARVYRVNEAACRLLGYSNPELLSLTFFDIDSNYTPAGWPDFHERIRREGMMVFESSHHHKNGTIIPVEVTTHWINLSGHDYICAFVRDITHHKPVRERLKEQGENPLELFLSQSLAGFFFMMLDHPVQWDNTIDKERCLDYVFEHQRITKVNDALLAQYGAKHTALTGMTPASLFLHDIPSGRRFWRKLFDNGCLHTEREECKLDGTPMWIEGDYICLYDNQGRITGHFGIQYDATERRRAAAQEAKLRAITEALPDLVFLVDEDGYYLEILTAESNLLYLNVEQLKGKRIQDVFPPSQADLYFGAITRTIQNGRSEILEYQLVVPAGKRWFEGRTGPMSVQFNNKRCAVFIARDITDRKRAEELQNQNIYLQEEIRSESNFGEIIGNSPVMQTVFDHIEVVAATDSTVLLTGETGTGKELIARAIHSRSGRKNNAMIKVNCGAMPAGLVESELFGHEKGAFTGATAQKQGKFELAHNGTIFLDEVGELPHDTQVKLLRVLQEQEFERIGGSKTIKVDARVIAATNRDLQKEMQRGAFRSDLFFRLNIFPIEVPPLRTRKDDIPLLTNYFIAQYSKKMGKRIKRINQGALDQLIRYHWPGNVRELTNILERAVILCQGSVLQKEHIGELGDSGHPPDEELLPLVEVERRHILKVLEKTGGVVAGPNGAAVLLGMNRSTLWSRMQKLGITLSKQIPKQDNL